ncbi:MAG: polysaccharide biosynthesis tyrosine autokinase [Chitinophagales bacterium]|nr:polysaccharide biosynthesis tyrosine autokinase [Chitinophagales bacterium]
MEQPNQQQISEKILKQFNSSFDFKRLLGTIVSNWYWFVLSISITVTAGFLYLRYTTPVYEIGSSILIDEAQDNVAQNVLSKLDPQNDKSKVNLFNEQVVLQSQDMIAKVVDSLALNVRYWARGRIKETEIYKESPIKVVFDTTGLTGGTVELKIKQVMEGQFEVTNGSTTDKVLYDTWVRKPYGRFKIMYTNGVGVNRGYLKSTEFIVKAEPRASAIGRVTGMFTVALNDGRTSLLGLSYTDNIPQRGVDFMNVLIYFYQKNELENINKKAEKTRAFLKAKKANIKDELRFIDSMQVDIKLNNDIVDPTAQTEQFMSAKTASETKMDELLMAKQSLESMKRTVMGMSTSRFNILSIATEDLTLGQLITAHNDLVVKREAYARSVGPEHPTLKEYEISILEQRKRIVLACDNAIAKLNITLQNAAKNAAEYTSRIRNTPNVERNIKDVTRGYDVLQQTYLLLYQKDVENEISVYAATNKSKVIVVPFATADPIKPVPKTIYAIVFLLGLLIPGSYLVIREMLNNKVINDHDIESLTNIPIVGSISRVEAASTRENTIVVGPHIRTGVAEQFRLIRANLEFMAAANNNRVFMITSSSSGEGKSFISINLGITMTLAKKRVVIMEFDLRKPKISQYLGLPNHGGISSYLAGLGDLDIAIKASGIHENLYIANCGPIPPNPGELLVLPKTGQMIEQLKEMFDVVIIDTAPIGLVSDALVLSQYAGINLFVIRQSYTIKDQVRMFDVLHKDGKIQNPAIIFNGVEFLKKYGYGYGGSGYGYSYGYGYGYGYYEETNPKKKQNGSSLKGFFTK